jgi:amidase
MLLKNAHKNADKDSIMATQGPMASSREGINLFMKTYLGSEPWIKEDNLVPIPWRSVTLPPKLKIAVMWSDGVVTPHPPVIRALKTVAEALSAAGTQFEIVDWKPDGHDECWKLTSALYYEDGGKTVETIIKEGGETVLPLTEWLIHGENSKYRTVEEVWDVSIFSASGNCRKGNADSR